MAVTTGPLNNLYTRKIDQTFFEKWDEEPEQWPRYLQAQTSDQHNETYQSFAGSVNWKTKAEMASADQDTFNPANLIVTEHVAYAVEIIASREAIRDDKYNVIIDWTADAGRAGRNTVETNSASVLNNAFDGTNSPIYDGQALCAAGHTYGKTGLAGTQTNLATGGITDVNVKAGINLFNTLKDEAGKQIVMNPSKFISHQNNQFEYATVFESALRAGSANHDKNVLPSLEWVGLNFLTSLTAWFLEAKQHKLIHFYREKPEFVKRPYMNPNQSQSWDGYFRDSTAIHNWRGLVGSQG
jgi:hypothetical protein